MSKPSDAYPALTEERLDIAVNFFRAAYHDAAIRHEPELGDNNWTLGCRRYAFACNRVVRGTVDYPWLSIVDGGGRIEGEEVDYFWTALRFVFAIGGVPLRFYRGDPTDVPQKSLRVAFPELHSKQIALWGNTEMPHALRFAIEADERGEVTQVTLVQVLDEEGKNLGESWPLIRREPSSDALAKVTPFTPRKDEGTNLGQPTVGSRKKKEEEESGEE